MSVRDADYPGWRRAGLACCWPAINATGQVVQPVGYSFIKKVSRITQGTGRSYDASDAAAYLRQYVKTSNRNKPVPLERVQERGKRYKSLCPIEVLREINALYRRTYGADGILLAGAGSSSRSGHGEL